MKRRIALAMLIALGIVGALPSPASAVEEVWINVEKSVDLDYYTPGDTIVYGYVVTGNAKFKPVVVSDDMCGPATYVSGDTNGDTFLNGAAGEAWQYTCSMQAPDPTPGQDLTNTVTVTGTTPLPLVRQDTDTYTLEGVILRKLVVLYWNYTDYVADPDAANVQFPVNVYKGGGLEGTEYVSPAQALELWLTPGSWELTEGTPPVGYQVLRGNWDIGIVPNAEWLDNTFFNAPTDLTYDLAIEKFGPEYAYGGGPVTYTYEVTNAGPRAVAPVVTDNKCSPVNFTGGDTNVNGKVDVGETWHYTCTYTPSWGAAFPNPLTNVVTVADVLHPSWTPVFGGDTCTSNNTDWYKLYPFVLRKDVGLYTGGTPNWAFHDNTPFWVKMYHGGVYKTSFVISEASPKYLWLSYGTWKFQEFGLPQGYYWFYEDGIIRYTTGVGYPDWSHLNVTWSGCSHGYWKNHTPWPGGILPTHLVGTYFPETDYYDATTLAAALDFGGGSGVQGGERILLKQAVAALLNETLYGSAFGPYASVDALKTAVNNALASNNRNTMIALAGTLDYWNNGICRH
jgi:hypothetical protein